jgi:hypothetical protein
VSLHRLYRLPAPNGSDAAQRNRAVLEHRVTTKHNGVLMELAVKTTWLINSKDQSFLKTDSRSAGQDMEPTRRFTNARQWALPWARVKSTTYFFSIDFNVNSPIYT